MILYNTKISNLLIHNGINEDNIEDLLLLHIVDSTAIMKDDFSDGIWDPRTILDLSRHIVGTAVSLPSTIHKDWIILYFFDMNEIELEGYLNKLFKLKVFL